MDAEQHRLAYHNTFLANQQGRYVLRDLLIGLHFFDPCDTPEESALRNFATELLTHCGIVYLPKDKPDIGEMSAQAFVDAIAKVDAGPLIDAVRRQHLKDTIKEDVYGDKDNAG